MRVYFSHMISSRQVGGRELAKLLTDASRGRALSVSAPVPSASLLAPEECGFFVPVVAAHAASAHKDREGTRWCLSFHQRSKSVLGRPRQMPAHLGSSVLTHPGFHLTIGQWVSGVRATISCHIKGSAPAQRQQISHGAPPPGSRNLWDPLRGLPTKLPLSSNSPVPKQETRGVKPSQVPQNSRQHFTVTSDASLAPSGTSLGW